MQGGLIPARARISIWSSLNSVEDTWANMNNGLVNLAANALNQLAALIRSRLSRMQHHPAPVRGFPGQTESSFDPGARSPAVAVWSQLNSVWRDLVGDGAGVAGH